MRRCYSCKSLKGFSEFWKCKSCTGGLDYRCIECKRREKLEKSKTPWGMYSQRCRILTTLVAHYHSKTIGPKPTGDFQLDHKWSVRAGFDTTIPIEVVAQAGNLQWLPTAWNRGKGSQCSITKDELYKLGTVDGAMVRVARALDGIEDADLLLRLAIHFNAKFKQKD